MKHHGPCKDASDKCRINLWLIFNFCDFLPNFEDFKPILATLHKLQGNEMKSLISIVEYLMTVNHVS